jgi:hypothetical protein
MPPAHATPPARHDPPIGRRRSGTARDRPHPFMPKGAVNVWFGPEALEMGSRVLTVLGQTWTTLPSGRLRGAPAALLRACPPANPRDTGGAARTAAGLRRPAQCARPHAAASPSRSMLPAAISMSWRGSSPRSPRRGVECQWSPGRCAPHHRPQLSAARKTRWHASRAPRRRPCPGRQSGSPRSRR